VVISIYTPFGQWRMKIIKRLPGLPVERALGVFSGRWKAVILDVLLDGPQRTCELEMRIVGISQKVLLEQLRALEVHGMVSRQSSAGHRQGIEYLLTDPLILRFRDDPRFAAFCRKVGLPTTTTAKATEVPALTRSKT